MKKFFYLAAAALVVTSSANAAIMIDGYIDAGYSSIEGDSNRGAVQASTSMNGFRNSNTGAAGTEAQSQFNVNEVNLDISADLSDRMRVFTSWDATDGNSVGPNTVNGQTGSGYSLVADYAYIEWAQPAGFDVNIRLGMVPSIVGVEQRVAESNLNDFANLSLLSPYTVGTVEGVTLSGTWSPVNWAVQLSNDDVLGAASVTGAVADVLRPRNSNGQTGAENEHGRNIAGRVGIVPLEGLEIGLSGWTSRTQAAPLASNPKNARTGFGADLGYTYGALKLGAEYYRIEEENTAAAGLNPIDDDVKAWYVYATYDVTDAITLGARYSGVDIDVAGVNSASDHDVSTISLLGKYNLTRDVAVKAQYDINDEDRLTGTITPTNQEADNDAFMLSVVASF